MPESRGFPRFLPRLGKDLSVTFAPPMDPALLSRVLDPWHARAVAQEAHANEVPLGAESDEKRAVRSELTDVIQRAVEGVGYSVAGPSLGRIPETKTT